MDQPHAVHHETGFPFVPNITASSAPSAASIHPSGRMSAPLHHHSPPHAPQPFTTYSNLTENRALHVNSQQNTSGNQPHRFGTNYDLSDSDALWEQDDDPDEDEEEHHMSQDYSSAVPEGNVSMLARTAFRRALVMNEISRQQALQEAVRASNGSGGISGPVDPLVAQGLLSSPLSQTSPTHALSPTADLGVMNSSSGRQDPPGRRMYWTPQEASMNSGGSNNMNGSSNLTVPPLDPMSYLSTSARRQLMVTSQPPLSSLNNTSLPQPSVRRTRSGARPTTSSHKQNESEPGTTRGSRSSNVARASSSNPPFHAASGPARTASRNNVPLRRSRRTAAARAAAAVAAQASPDVDQRKMPAKRSPNVSSKSCKLSSMSTSKSKCDPLKHNGPSESSQKSDPDKNCCICLEKPSPAELSKLSGCSHTFCFSCIEKWAERENTCPLCKARFTKIERVHKVKTGKRKRGSGKESGPCNVKRVKNRDQRSDSRLNPFQHIFASAMAEGSGLTRIIVDPRFPIDDDALHASLHAFEALARTARIRSQFAATSSSSPPSVNHSASHQPFENSMGFFSRGRSLNREQNPFATVALSTPFNPHLFRRVALDDFASSRGFNVTPPRSFASNRNMANAGQSAATALEIVDSDDDDDELVEVMSS